MNWLITALQKEATRRRFAPDDLVRYFYDGRKGTGKGVVLTPQFARGRIVDYDPQTRQYKVWNENDRKEILVHPRNIVPDQVNRSRPEPVETQPTEPLQVQSPALQMV